MLRHSFATVLSLSCTVLITAAARGQCPTTVIGFNGPPINDPGSSFEIFRIPQVSGTTAAFIVANTSGNNNNSTYRASGFQTEGDAGLETFFDWVDPTNTDSWVRLTTFGGAIRPNPALHTEGKVRFKIKNLGNFATGRIGLCLGVRESGVLAPQLADGGTAGPVEWVGVSTAPSAITPGPDTVLDSIVAGDDELRTLAVGSAIVAGPNGVLDSVAANDDVVGSGFTYTNAVPAERRPLPVITLNITPAAVDLEWDLATGVVSVNGVPSGGGFGGFTGDGDLSAPNNRGTLEQLAITVVDGTRVRFVIDELQFEAPESDPLLPPRVVSPIVLNDPTVTVTSVNSCIDQVALLRNHVVLLTAAPSPNTDVVFTLPAGAVAGDVYTATQRDSISGLTSAESNAVTVTSGPPPYTFSIIVDEDDDCIDTDYEIIGAISNSNLDPNPRTGNPTAILPIGQDLFPNSAVWQTVDLSLAGPITAWIGGNGVLAQSATGLWGVDSFWFTISGSGQVGPHEVFMDAIQALDASDAVIGTMHSFDDSQRFFTSVRGQSANDFTSSDLSTLASYDGRTSHRITWTYSAAANRSLGLLDRTSAGSCGTRPRVTDDGAKLRFHFVLREPPINALPLPVVIGPIVQGNVTIRVQNDATATATQLYIDGQPVGAPGVPVGGFTEFPGVSVATGESISAKQTIGGIDSDFAYPKAVLPAPIPPGTPSIQAPVEDGDTSVSVTGVTADTTLLEILDGVTVIGSLPVSNPGPNNAVPIPASLQHLQSLSVRASNSAGSSTSPAGAALEVGIGNGDVYVCIGVRENNDPGPLGSPATIGTSAAIEWIGATAILGGSPIGIPLSPFGSWVTLTFDPVAGPVRGFTGNGVIDVPRGSLEHLALTMNSSSAARSSGLYEIFVDNVWNLNADGGPDFLLTDFEAFAIGQEVMFQEPTFSGTTAGNMAPTPSSSGVSNVQGNPNQSARLVCFFRNTAAGRWARITTSSTVNPLRNPIIDLTHPVRLDILILPSTPPAQPGDVDGDGDVDLSDLALLLSSFGLCSGNPGYQAGADFDGTGCIELSDLAVLLSNFGT